MRIFVVLRAWQLFLVQHVPLLILIAVIPYSISTGQSLSPHVFGFAIGLLGLTVYGWIYSIGVIANQRVGAQHQRGDVIFKGGLIYAVLYAFVFGSVVSAAKGMPLWLVPAHLVSAAATIYALWFAGKQLMCLRHQRDVEFLEVSGPMFLIWTFPLGVWFVQPVVNDLLTTPAEVTPSQESQND